MATFGREQTQFKGLRLTHGGLFKLDEVILLAHHFTHGNPTNCSGSEDCDLA